MTTFNLQGKVALVTGASGGIGNAIARKLAESGATVVVTYVGSAEDTSALVSELDSAGCCAFAEHLDQRSPESVESLVESIKGRHGRLDVLVNNAAWNIGIPFGDLEALTLEVWDRVLETNLRGPFLLTRAAAPLLKAHGRGRIINISSIGGIVPLGSSIAYSASKAGLNHLTRCLAVAMGPQVSVNCIAAGLVENTGMSNRAMTPEAQEASRKATVMGTAAQLDDIVAQVMAFITSTSITGQVIAIDGGLAVAMR